MSRGTQPTTFCRVALWRQNGSAILEIADDGRGIGAYAGEGSGQGLNNMRARAAALGGVLTIDAGPRGLGTAVRAIVAPVVDRPACRALVRNIGRGFYRVVEAIPQRLGLVWIWSRIADAV